MYISHCQVTGKLSHCGKGDSCIGEVRLHQFQNAILTVS